MRRAGAALAALTMIVATGCTTGGGGDSDEVLADWCVRIEAAYAIGDDLLDNEDLTEDDIERFTELAEDGFADPVPEPIEDDVVLLRGDGDLPDDGVEAMELITDASSRLAAFAEEECGVTVDDPPLP